VGKIIQETGSIHQRNTQIDIVTRHAMVRLVSRPLPLSLYGGTRTVFSCHSFTSARLTPTHSPDPSCRRRELQAHIYRLKQTLSTAATTTTVPPSALQQCQHSAQAAVAPASAPAVGTSQSQAEARGASASGQIAEQEMTATPAHTALSGSTGLGSRILVCEAASQVPAHPPVQVPSSGLVSLTELILLVAFSSCIPTCSILSLHLWLLSLSHPITYNSPSRELNPPIFSSS
jgi:hypothetical protein